MRYLLAALLLFPALAEAQQLQVCSDNDAGTRAKIAPLTYEQCRDYHYRLPAWGQAALTTSIVWKLTDTIQDSEIVYTKDRGQVAWGTIKPASPAVSPPGSSSSTTAPTMPAGVTVTPGDWPLYRGTSIVSRHATESACIQAAKALVARTYTCRTTTTVVVSAASSSGGGASSGSSGATRSATVSWTAPTANTNESALTNLAGYRLYYGNSASNLSNTVQLALLTSHTVNGLSAGTWYFAVSAVNAAGVESQRSTMVSKVL